jgi:hypothetical protein
MLTKVEPIVEPAVMKGLSDRQCRPFPGCAGAEWPGPVRPGGDAVILRHVHGVNGEAMGDG